MTTAQQAIKDFLAERNLDLDELLEDDLISGGSISINRSTLPDELLNPCEGTRGKLRPLRPKPEIQQQPALQPASQATPQPQSVSQAPPQPPPVLQPDLTLEMLALLLNYTVGLVPENNTLGYAELDAGMVERQRKKMANRLASRLSRKRRDDKIEELAKRVAKLEKTNAELCDTIIDNAKAQKELMAKNTLNEDKVRKLEAELISTYKKLAEAQKMNK